ncbi:hypothetical protein EBQ34_14860, partial [Vandammella animalimorsus]
TRSLDLLGRVTQQSTTHSAAQLSGSSAYQSRQNYQWDANSRRTQLHTPASGSNPEYRIHSSWDAAGQLQSLQASSDTSPNQFTHDGAGRLTHIQRSDGSSTSYQYTPDGHISQIRHQGSQGQPLAQFDYQHNRDGQRTQAVEVIHAAGSTAPTTQRTINWTYDPAGKLTQEQITQTQPSAQTLTIAYQYDKVGNRTSRTVTGAINQTTTYQYDANDRLTSQNDSLEGTTSYRYDRKGNLVEKANGNNKTAYSWNSDNRLIKVEHSSGATVTKTTTYGYDPQGRRIKKLVQQGTSKTETHYSLDTERPYHEVAVESTRVNTQPWTHKTYVHTPGGVGELISQSDGATTKQIYADAQGTTRLIADGNTSRSYSFDAFGNWLEGDSLAADQNPPTHLYTGERYDADTGLIYLRARDYAPSIGRFISMDEHPGDQRIPLTLNKYLYANADPVNFIDPSGNFFGGAGLSGVGQALANISLSASVRLTLLGGRLASKFPKISMAVNIAASILMPMEIQLAAGNANFGGLAASLSYSAMWKNAHQLSAMANTLRSQGNFIGVGGNLEDFVSASMNLEKNTARYYVGNKWFVPDFVLPGGNLLETKASIGAVTNAQLLKYSQWMQEGGGNVMFLFYKKPTAAELARKERYIFDALGSGAPVPQILYIFE